MSSKLEEGRKERIALMLEMSKEATKDCIEFFEQRVAENPKDNTKEFFNQVVWVKKPKFMAQFKKIKGNRSRLVEEYFNILIECEDIMENYHRLGAEKQEFRNCEVVNEYLQNHKFN